MNDEKKAGFFAGDGRMLFLFGLVTGVALMFTFENGIALPSLNNGEKYNENEFAQDDPNGQGAQPTGELVAVTKNDHVKGDLDKAKVVLVEYSDYQCPYCQKHHPTIQQIADEYGDDVAWVFRHFPLTSIHPNAEPAALAAECAADQGKFWEFSDALFENQDKLGSSYYSELAKELGLNVSKFENCFSKAEHQDDVDEDVEGGLQAGVQGTPATFVNGIMISGAVPYESLKSVIEQELLK